MSDQDLAAPREDGINGDTSGVRSGRWRADIPPGTVVFLIGMRINSIWSPRDWLPVFVAMPKMLRELFENPELGLLGARTWMSWRLVMVQQYWASMDQLMSYAAERDAQHLPAWRAFNRRARASGSVGIWHEAYIVDAAGSHVVYANMPLFGMGEATRLVPAHGVQPVTPRAELWSGPADWRGHGAARLKRRARGG